MCVCVCVCVCLSVCLSMSVCLCVSIKLVTLLIYQETRRFYPDLRYLRSNISVCDTSWLTSTLASRRLTFPKVFY